MQTPSEAQIRTRIRLRDDFEFYAANALKIRTKKAKIEPLILNHAQKILDEARKKQLAETGMVRIIILKARQQGLSTYVEGRIYQRTSQARAKKAVVVTHKASATTALFTMTKRYHENVPDAIRPSTSYSSKRELAFDKLDSSYIVETAGGDDIARGETLTHAHLSELAFWPTASARSNLNGLLQSVPDEPDTEVYIESTANGVTGPFYEYWQGAVEGTNGYAAVFIPWFRDLGYQRVPPRDFELTPDEIELQGLVEAAYSVKLTLPQLYWRRLKVNQSGLDLFKQEYPAFPEEAFLTTGRPVFNPTALTQRRAELLPPIDCMSHVLGAFESAAGGELKIYKEIDDNGTYTIGADVAMGVRGGDFSVAQVLDERKVQVATFRGHVHPDYFADVLADLGAMFHYAKIAVESNNHGLLTVNRLYKDLSYPNVFLNVIEDKMTDVDTPQLGFRTTSRTRPMIIDSLRAAVRDEIVLNDPVTIKEMLTFVVKESGKPEAEVSCHDDCVMALAIANHVHDGVWEALVLKDSDYLEMI